MTVHVNYPHERGSESMREGEDFRGRGKSTQLETSDLSVARDDILGQSSWA